jgi:hypothetical protein
MTKASKARPIRPMKAWRMVVSEVGEVVGGFVRR